MTESTLENLTGRVTAYFQKHAKRYHLKTATVEVHPVLAPPGTGSISFTISDGEVSYHLKLSARDDLLVGLERWAYLNQRLSENYHAPLMFDWIKLPALPYEGPLFEYLPEKKTDLVHQPELFKKVLDLLARLHTDQEMVKQLASLDEEEEEAIEDEEDKRPAGLAYTYLDSFLDSFIDRFDGDLAEIAGGFPPFITSELDNWMMGETRELEGLARELPAFQHLAASPIHGDLRPDALLVKPDGAWYIVAWEDVDLGDPALDYSILLGSLWRSGCMTIEEAERYLPGPDSSEREDLLSRFQLYIRAILLDEIVDSAALWIEAARVPDLQAEIRAEKERKHDEALELYRGLY